MIYEVLITDCAARDFDDIARYIAEDLENPIAAESFVSDVEQAISSLSEFPLRGTLVRDIWLSAFQIRFALVRNHYVFYQTDTQSRSVYVLRILHTRREWLSLLTEQFPLPPSDVR